MSIKRISKDFLLLTPEDFRILAICEQLMITHKYAPFDQFPSKAMLSSTLVRKRIRKLNEKKYVKRWVGSYEGYILTYHGFDILALKALVEGDFIEAIGDPIGVGKEADVISCKTPLDELVALKLHRLGKEFKKTRRFRPYIAKRRHISSLYESRLAAQREYQALTRLSSLIRVPKPIAQNRHAIVMEFIEGDELQIIRSLEEDVVLKIANTIIKYLFDAYDIAQVIHGDFSEYNCIITPELEPVLIDWPQWIETSHPNSKELFFRDISNITSFFKRRFGLSLPEAETFINDFS